MISAAEFALNTVALSPAGALEALGHISTRYGRNGPSRTVEELLDVLDDRYNMVEAVELLRTYGT